MKKEKNLESDIIEFLELWNSDQMRAFIHDILPLVQLYYIEEDFDWVEQEVGNEDARNVRIIRTVYLMSRIAEAHAAKLATIKMNFKDIYKRMEKQGTVILDE